MTYSVKCAALRVIMWIMRRVSGVVFGNNHNTSGPMMRDVFPALKLSEEA